MAVDISPAGLAGLREKALAATAAPWVADAPHLEPRTIWAAGGDIPVCELCRHVLRGREQQEHDLAYLLAANPATVLALLAAVAELWAACEAALTELQFKRFSEAGRLGIGLTIPELEEKYGLTDTMKQLKAALAGKDGSP